MNQGAAPKVSFVSLGCPKALVDSERIITRLRAEGYELARKHDGAGLGLTFVSRVASQHGGKLHIASRLGQGTVITITFPLDHAAIREVA